MWVQRCFKSEKKSQNKVIDCTLQAPPGALKAIQLFYWSGAGLHFFRSQQSSITTFWTFSLKLFKPLQQEQTHSLTKLIRSTWPKGRHQAPLWNYKDNAWAPLGTAERQVGDFLGATWWAHWHHLVTTQWLPVGSTVALWAAYGHFSPLLLIKWKPQHFIHQSIQPNWMWHWLSMEGFAKSFLFFWLLLTFKQLLLRSSKSSTTNIVNKCHLSIIKRRGIL